MQMEQVQVRPLSETSQVVVGFFRRRFGVIWKTALVIAALVGIFLVFAPRKYTATVHVLIDARRNVLNDERGGVLNYLMPSDDAVETEIANLTTRNNAAVVVKELHLDKSDDFTKPSKTTRLFSLIGLGDDQDPRDTPERRAQNNVKENLTATRIGQSYAIEVGFTWKDPFIAAKVANALVKAHVEREAALRREVVEANTKELLAGIDARREKIKELEARLAQARAKAGVLNLQSTTVGNEIGQLRAQQAAADGEAALASARNRAAVAQSAVNSDFGLQQLHTQLNLALADAASNGSRYGSQHPLSIEGQRKIAALKAAIAAQTAQLQKSALASLNVEAAAQAQRAAAQHSAMAEAKQQMQSSLQSTGQVAELEHERDYELQIYEADYDRYKRIRNTLDSVGDLTVETTALPPQLPTLKVKLVLALGILMALFGGMMAGLVSEVLGMFSGKRQTAEPAEG